MFWKRILVEFDSFVCTFDIRGLKRRSANQQSVKNNSNAPNVNFIRMSRSAAQDLRSNVVGSSTNCSLSFPVKHNFRGKSKVSYFHFHLVFQKQVSQLQISMNNLLRMHILCRFHNLSQIIFRFHITQSFPSLDHIVERQILAKLKHDVNIVLIFKVGLKIHNTVMSHRLMNLDLRHQLRMIKTFTYLLLRSRFRKRRLLNDLSCKNSA